MKFIHLTDTHLSSPGEKIFGIDGRRRLQAAIKSVNRNHPDAALCVVTGDIAEHGERAAYESFSALMRKLHCPYYFILGNHDVRAVARKVFPELPWRQNNFLQYSLQTELGRFILLDTLRSGFDSGRMCEERLAHLKRELESAQQAAEDVYLFMHHAPLNVGIRAMDNIKLENSEIFYETLRPFLSRIKHLFFGHLHRSCHGVWRNIPFSTLKSTAHQIAPVMDGRSGYVGSREMPAYSVVLLQESSVVVHGQSFLEDGKIIADYQ